MESSNEFCSIDENGKKIDAHLHDEFLEGPEADAIDLAQRQQLADKLRAAGVAESMIEEMYGPFDHKKGMP